MIYAVIPVKDEAALACNVVALAIRERDVYVRVCDNDSTESTRSALKEFGSERCEVIDAAGKGLYQMWDEAWSAAHQQSAGEPYEIAFLNSDIDFLPCTLAAMRYLLRREGFDAVCPNYQRRVSEGTGVFPEHTVAVGVHTVHGSYRHGGLAGWCFMVRGELRDRGIKVDTSFRWWAGDDDLFFQIEEAGGKLGIIEALPLDHIGEATARHYPWTETAKARDMARLRTKWGTR
jgi:GT2 family glycosyltransferase